MADEPAVTEEISFSDADDARRYLGEVGSLWAVWVVALLGITFFVGGLRLLFGVAGFAGVMWRATPLQRRAADLVPDPGIRAGLRGGRREKTFRTLAYGAAPLRAAVDAAAASPIWFSARYAMLGLTIAGFALVVINYLAV